MDVYKVAGSDPVGRGFESLRARQFSGQSSKVFTHFLIDVLSAQIFRSLERYQLV